MISEQEANQLMTTLVSLRNKVKEDKNNSVLLTQLAQHENLCMNKFAYLVHMKTNRYKVFANYPDLNQEGFEALLKAMKTYNPKKGNFFSWIYKYINTRISRQANLHTTIRYPLKFTQQFTPHRENKIPNLIEEESNNPDRKLETKEAKIIIENYIDILNDEQRKIINIVYGLNGEEQLSISKACLKLNISRAYCLKILKQSYNILEEEIFI